MPSLHLTKVAVGCATIDALRRRVASRSRGGECPVVTRMRPRRADELIGGNLYWIVRHRLVARQSIIRIDDRDDGRIAIILADRLEPIAPRPKRAHQGWRYLEEATLENSDTVVGAADLPPRLYGRLAALALV